MKRDTSRILLAVLLFVILELFILNPAFTVSQSKLVCEGSYVIDNIDTTADLEALSGCTSVTGDLSIISSPLTSLEGLQCLTHVRGELRIERNDSLTSLAGLESLKSVGRLSFRQNNSVTSFVGLESLESVGHNMGVWQNPSLTSLAGLESLKSVQDWLIIAQNDSLTSLAALKSLKFVGGDLQIEDNHQLCRSLAVDLSNQVDIGQSTRIYGNKPDC